jgi:hypothetical protein
MDKPIMVWKKKDEANDANNVLLSEEKRNV